MYLDFHYYGGYAAARLGGMDHKKAFLVAYCDQYVDEMDYAFDSTKEWTYQGRSFKPVVMSIGFGNLADTAASYTKSEEYWRKVWIPFHFLPGGNYNYEFMTPPGGASDNKDDWKLICAPNNQLARDMINDTIDIRKSSDIDYGFNLHLLGLRMHVYVDT